MSPVSGFTIPKIGCSTEQDLETPSLSVTEMVDYSNGKITAGLGYLVFTVVLVANVYVIVMLAMGKSG
jgi:hypothetical protein